MHTHTVHQKKNRNPKTNPVTVFSSPVCIFRVFLGFPPAILSSISLSVFCFFLPIFSPQRRSFDPSPRSFCLVELVLPPSRSFLPWILSTSSTSPPPPLPSPPCPPFLTTPPSPTGLLLPQLCHLLLFLLLPSSLPSLIFTLLLFLPQITNASPQLLLVCSLYFHKSVLLMALSLLVCSTPSIPEIVPFHCLVALIYVCFSHEWIIPCHDLIDLICYFFTNEQLFSWICCVNVSSFTNRCYSARFFFFHNQVFHVLVILSCSFHRFFCSFQHWFRLSIFMMLSLTVLLLETSEALWDMFLFITIHFSSDCCVEFSQFFHYFSCPFSGNFERSLMCDAAHCIFWFWSFSNSFDAFVLQFYWGVWLNLCIWDIILVYYCSWYCFLKLLLQLFSGFICIYWFCYFLFLLLCKFATQSCVSQ